MPANKFGRYVWLIDTFRRYKHLSYKEVSDKWQKSGLSYGDGDELPLRTFHNHRKAILDIFNIIIEIDPEVKGYKYHIVNPEDVEGDGFRCWLIDSYATLNQIQADNKLRDRIIYEDIPSGHTWLTVFMQAMRENKVLSITHQSFGKYNADTFEIEPYCLKVVKKRWYIIANNPYYEKLNKQKEQGSSWHKEILTYGLDRITQVTILDKTFEIKKDFNVKKYFEGCAGIIASNDPIEHVVLKAYDQTPDYLRTLPLHESQKEICRKKNFTTFSYDVKLTYDFLQLIMQQGSQVEVLEPKRLRDMMRTLAKTLTAYYKE